MRHPDWGVVEPARAGIRSATARVRGVEVHHLVRDADPVAPSGAPIHVLVSAMAGSATNWLDLIPLLARHGRVIVPDLPGTLTGHTAAPLRLGPRAETSARFVRAFVRTLDLDRVVLHGWSMGGLVSVRAADLELPVLLLWGTDDPLADDATLQGHAGRAGWTPHVVHGAGHLLPLEVPRAYADAVGAWLSGMWTADGPASPARR